MEKKSLSGYVSKEAFRVMSDYKLDNGLKRNEEAIEGILLDYKKMKEKKK